jgi:DNA-directed RNA polymerase specialized sigma24 family protein
MTRTDENLAAPPIDFAGLYGAYAHDLRRFALYLSGDAALADDLVSEAFVRAWTVRERVEMATVRGYLFAIVRNLFLSSGGASAARCRWTSKWPTAGRGRAIGLPASGTCTSSSPSWHGCPRSIGPPS